MIRGWYACHVGMVRQENQDRFYFNNQRGCFAVFDGMGGHAGGEAAARAAMLAVAASYPDGRLSEVSAHACVNAAAQAVIREARGSDAGTTAVLLGIQGQSGVLAHCGDSRCYRLRAGQLECLTKDHSVVQEAIDRGNQTEGSLAILRRDHGGMITNALGRGYRGPTMRAISLQAGDAFLLCSDGLNGMLPDETIASIMRAWQYCDWVGSVGNDVFPDVAESLVAAANAAGGKDNVTVGVAVVE